MNTKLTKNIIQTIGGVLALIILMCAGMFLYARWDLKRFRESFGELPEVSPMIAPQTEKVTNTDTEEVLPAETTAPKPVAQHNIELESDGLEMETPSLETLDSLIDGLALSEVEYSEVETADVQRESLEKEEVLWADKFQEEIGSGTGLASLISALKSGNIDMGSDNSEDVATIVEIFKRSAGGPIAVDDLITAFEAWLRIDPDLQIQSTFLQLRNNKEKSLQSGKKITYTIDYTIEEQ